MRYDLGNHAGENGTSPPVFHVYLNISADPDARQISRRVNPGEYEYDVTRVG